MPNLIDLQRVIQSIELNVTLHEGNSDEHQPNGALLEQLVRRLVPDAGMQKAAREGLKPLADVLGMLPRTLLDAFPRNGSTVAGNGELVRLPVHARRFKFVYLESYVPHHSLQKIVKDHGVSLPVLREQNGQGCLAAYAIDFLEGDIGPYQEFFLMIKLDSKTYDAAFVNDLFVWRLCVNSHRAAAWGTPWDYPKKVQKDLKVEIPDDISTDGVITFTVPRGEVSNFDNTKPVQFPFMDFRFHYKARSDAPRRWSHEAQGGGFSFVNPGTEAHPRGFTAPVQNQGEIWNWDQDAIERENVTWDVTEEGNEFALLKQLKWHYVGFGRNFEAVARAGFPLGVLSNGG
jgi:hypothetical protein